MDPNLKRDLYFNKKRQWPVADAANDGAGEELEEGEDGAEESAKEDSVEGGGGAHQAAEQLHLGIFS